jgi:hypothetical protein
VNLYEPAQDVEWPWARPQDGATRAEPAGKVYAT